MKVFRIVAAVLLAASATTYYPAKAEASCRWCCEIKIIVTCHT